jgi:hypothetical protein
MHSIPFHGADSSSAGSSCNSSSPSSPALLTIPPQTPANKSQFNFPEIPSSSSSSLVSSQNTLSHHSNTFSSYPNTIIEDAEPDLQQQNSKSNNFNSNMHSRYQSSPNGIDVKINGSINSVGELLF